MPLDKDKERVVVKKRWDSRGSRGISAPKRSWRHRFALAWYSTKGEEFLTLAFNRRSPRTIGGCSSFHLFGGKEGPWNCKECRVPGNRPNIFVYIETPRYKRRKCGIRVIPIFRDRCIYNRILCFLSPLFPRSFQRLPPLFLSQFHSHWLWFFSRSTDTRGYPLHSTTTSLSGVATQLFSCLYLPGSSLVERFYCVRSPDLKNSSTHRTFYRDSYRYV